MLTILIIILLILIIFLNEKNRKLLLENGKLKFFLEEKEKNLIEIINIKEQLSSQFELISKQIIEKQKESFNKEQKNSLDNILNPLKEQLKNYEKKLLENKEKLIENSSSMKTQIDLLMEQSNKIGSEANNLAIALKNDKKAQGNWGELKLKNLLESVGLVEGIDYFSQKNEKDSNGREFILDFIINLPDNRKLIIDSKVSIVNYERYINNQDKKEQKQFLEAYYKDIIKHIKELGDKKYHELYGNETPNFVFMFLPLEGAYFEVINYDIREKNDSNLFDIAFKNKVNMVTGSSLIPVLKTIEHLWNIEKQNKNVEKIGDLCTKMCGKISSFIKAMKTIDSSLAKAKESYNNAINYLHDGRGNILKIANDISLLSGKSRELIQKESLSGEDSD